MAADAMKVYNSFRKKMGQGNIKLDVDTFRAILCSAASNCADASLVKLADVTGELSGNGYSGFTMTVTWTPDGAVMRWGSDNPEFEANGGDLVARYLVVYDDTPTTPDADPLVGWILLDNAPANITVPDGSVLRVTIDPDGIFDLSGM